MSEKHLKLLFKSSEEAASNQVRHVLLAVLPDGRPRVNGTDDLVNGFKEV